MTEPPVYKTREEHEAEQKAAAAAAAEAAKGPVLSAPVREKLEALIGKEPQGDLGTFPLAFGDKATRLMVQLAVPAAVVAAPAAAAAAAAPASGRHPGDEGRPPRQGEGRQGRGPPRRGRRPPEVEGRLLRRLLPSGRARRLRGRRGPPRRFRRGEGLGPSHRERPGPPGRARRLPASPRVQRRSLRGRQGGRALRLLRAEVRRPGRQQVPEDRRARLRGAFLQPGGRPRDEEAEPAADDLDQAQERLHDRRPPAPGRTDGRSGTGGNVDRSRPRSRGRHRRRQSRRLLPPG